MSHKKFALRLPKPVAPELCSQSAFPEALRPLCEKPNAEEILQRLGEPRLLASVAGTFSDWWGLRRCALIG